MDDKEIIFGIKNNSKDAFGSLVDKYTTLLIKVISSVLKESHEKMSIEECYNDTIFAIWNKIDTYEGKCEFKIWIATIAKYKALDYKRSLKKPYKVIEFEEYCMQDKSTEEVYIEIEDLQVLNEIVEELEEADKELFNSKYIVGKSNIEICKEFGIKEQTLYKRISRLKKKIKKKLECREEVL